MLHFSGDIQTLVEENYIYLVARSTSKAEHQARYISTRLDDLREMPAVSTASGINFIDRLRLFVGESH